MSELRIGKLGGTINWSDGSPFNGYAVVGIVLPTVAAVPWVAATLENSLIRQVLPLWAGIPIEAGVFNTAAGLLYNADINPPNTKYAIYYFDQSLQQVGTPSGAGDFFTIAAATTIPPTYTLTVPTAGTTVPVPN